MAYAWEVSVQYYELTLTVQLTEDLNFFQSFERIGRSISRVMLEDWELARIHSRTGFKHYVFNSFYPVEMDGIYKAGKVYIFKIRSLSESFIRKMAMLLPRMENHIYKVLSTQTKSVKKTYIGSIYTLTPVIISIGEGKNWTKEGDFLLLQNRLQANLEKKYKIFYGEELAKEDNFSFIQRMELVSKKAMAVPYKKINFLGNKLRLWVNEDEKSQNLAFIAMACGLGEKNTSLGAGFCTGGNRE